MATACRFGLQPSCFELPELEGAEKYLTAQDHECLDGLRSDLGDELLLQHRECAPPTTHGEILWTTWHYGTNVESSEAEAAEPAVVELLQRYDEALSVKRVAWQSDYVLTRRLGAGGQGVVFLSSCEGYDGFSFPVAVKVFSPQRYRRLQRYESAMRRIARVSGLVAQIHHENLLDLFMFVQRDGIRMLVMEWIDGYDLQRLMMPSVLAGVKSQVSHRLWEFIDRVIVTKGPVNSRLKAGVAVSIIRDCLHALEALHAFQIVHGDIKLSNIMVKYTGHAKIIDMGSAFRLDEERDQLDFTPAYAAPEVLEHKVCTPQSDLASLGYVLVELLSGRSLFAECASDAELLEVKWSLPKRLESLLPEDVTKSEVLMNFCHRLIAPDPIHRFASAREAVLHRRDGASLFQFELVRGNLASAFDYDLQTWIEAVKEWDEATMQAQ